MKISTTLFIEFKYFYRFSLFLDPGVVSNVLISSSNETILLMWSQPQQPNGKILNYLVEWKDQNYIHSYGNDTTASLNYTITSLDPFTMYAVMITARTSVGYGEKLYSTIMTQVGSKLRN